MLVPKISFGDFCQGMKPKCLGLLNQELEAERVRAVCVKDEYECVCACTCVLGVCW